MKPCKIAIIGAGWRAQFFARCAKALPERFELVAVVSTSAKRASAFACPCYPSVDEMLKAVKLDYAILSVKAAAAAEVLLNLVSHGVPVLMETPAATDMETLQSTYSQLPKGAKVQVAEQYFLRPVQQAHLNVLASEKLGKIREARVSLTNDYHSISLLRKYLDIGFENARIFAHQVSVKGYTGYERSGVPCPLPKKDQMHTIAILEFSKCVGIHDYEDMQHRSFIRTSCIQLKGEKGEVYGDTIKMIHKSKTPMESRFLRQNMGEDENIEGCGLKGIMTDGVWVYKNPFPNARLADDEIAVAETMVRMAAYINGGDSFYDYSQAAQDVYLSLLIKQAISQGACVTSQTQPWAKA